MPSRSGLPLLRHAQTHTRTCGLPREGAQWIDVTVPGAESFRLHALCCANGEFEAGEQKYVHTFTLNADILRTNTNADIDQAWKSSMQTSCG